MRASSLPAFAALSALAISAPTTALAQALSDSFDNYSGALNSNGWTAFCGVCTGANTSTAQASSLPNSAEIGFCTDSLLSPGILTAGAWNFTINTYIVPGAPGKITLSLLNTATPCAPNTSVQLDLDGGSGQVFCKNNGLSIPLVTGQWVPLRVQLDLSNNLTCAVTYNGNKFVCSSPWTSNGSTSLGAALAFDGLRVENQSAGSTGFYFLDDAEMTCAADFNHDGALDFFDVLEFINCFMGFGCPPGTDADFNGDCNPDFFDWNDFMTAFQNGC